MGLSIGTHTHMAAHGVLSGEMKLTHPVGQVMEYIVFIILYWRISRDYGRSGVIHTTARNCVVK